MLRCVLLISCWARYQTTPCVDPAWATDDIIVQKDIAYGSVVDAATGKNLTLLLDVYLPPASDKRPVRPGAVIVHGGSFEKGSKNQPRMKEWAYSFAVRGFVAVSINYRLDGYYFGFMNDKAALAATEDARAAVRYMRKMEKEWRIDSERILLGGGSAGAITSLTYGYVKMAQYEGHSGNPRYSSSIALSVSVSGQLKDEAHCKSIQPKPSGCAVEGGPKNDHTDDVDGSKFQPPLLMVHGTADSTVPYVNGKAVYDRAQAAGIKSKLITIPGAGHVPFDQLFHQGTYLQEFMAFTVDALKLGAAECPQTRHVVV